MDSVIESMQTIVAMDMPFQKMSDLANLVFKATELRDQVLEDKYRATVRRLEQDRKMVDDELQGAKDLEKDEMLSDDQITRIQEKANEIIAQYDVWLSSLSKTTPNMDSYITASNGSVSGFRRFITAVMNEGTNKPIHIKRISVIECVPAANKKVTSAEDVEKVLDAIRTKLLAELKNNDEVDLH